MKPFMDRDFLLGTETAKRLFHEDAEGLPILDFHNHLSPKEIYEDKCFKNLSDVWLGGDHYKWRAMRANGVPEKLVTGDGDPYQKFLAWADTVEKSMGNPLYHWTHLELQRYFGITTPLSRATADAIYREANAQLAQPEFSVRNLLRRQKVEVLCTTDDPADSLEWHRKLKEDGFEIKVLPSFRPEKAIGIEKPGFVDYLKRLAEAAGASGSSVSVTGSSTGAADSAVEVGVGAGGLAAEAPGSSAGVGVGGAGSSVSAAGSGELTSVDAIVEALKKRLAFFVSMGCRVSDHSLENEFYLPPVGGAERVTREAADRVLAKRLSGSELTEEEAAVYHGYILREMGKAYASYGMVMQLHIGALRNNSSRMFKAIGPDTGFDSIDDFSYARQLSALLDSMDAENALPRTILYYVNRKDTDMLAAMAGNFQGNEEGIRGKVQLGSAWWFGDHIPGMERQLESLATIGLLSTFVGMLTDSRSFLSFPRHEYFRRILCNVIGRWVENGEYPDQPPVLGGMVKDICYRNAKEYFGF